MERRMMVKRGITALLLAGSFICGIIAGCGKEEKEENRGNEGKESVSEAGAEELTKNIPAAALSYRSDPQYAQAQKFAGDLFLRCLGEENPVISPVSAYIALSLAGSGAESETKKEFETLFGGEHLAVSAELMKELAADRENIKLTLADSVWIDDRMKVKEDWLSGAKNAYAAQVFKTELSTERTMRDINWWIEENTQGLIRNFLTEPLDKDMMLALFNTVYFKGKWVMPFEERDTYERPFTLENKKVVNVPTMNLYRKNLACLQTNDGEGVALHYSDSDLVFVALKPLDASVTVREMLAKTDLKEIAVLADQAKTENVNLHLPKFETAFDRKLNEDLIALGLVSAFDENRADFSGLGTADDGSGVYIDIVRQKAVFKLDEDGTEAAAVTEVGMMKATAMLERDVPREMDFNVPFLYMVLDGERDLPLFVGIMDNPEKASK